MGALLSTQRTEAEAEVQLGTFFFPARHPAPEGAQHYSHVSYSGPMIQSVSQVRAKGKRYPDTNGRLLATKLRVNLSFVNGQVSSTVLCGPTYTDPYYPLTHEHGW